MQEPPPLTGNHIRFMPLKETFKMMSATECPRRLSRLAPVMLGILLCAVAALWLRTSGEPLIDQFSFRQCQTAITAQWFDFGHPIHSFLDYETPVFGTPWQVPFEFPLYQAIAAGISQGLGLPLTNCGRLLSAFIFLLTLFPLHSLAKGLGLGRRFFYLAAFFLICSPFYLYWSRAFLIESTAVFLGFAFVAAVERAAASSLWKWWGLAGFLAIACALVKSTTYPSFAVASAAVVLLKSQPGFDRPSLVALVKPLSILCGIGIISLFFLTAWTAHADAVKAHGFLTTVLTSQGLHDWNYGTLRQKLDLGLWREIVWDRTLPGIFGSLWVAGFGLAAALACRGRDATLITGMVVLFLIPIALFTNLHKVHIYYQYANAFWLILAVALAMTVWSRKVPVILSLAAIFLILITQLLGFYRGGNYHWMRLRTSPALAVAKVLKARIPQSSSILVLGDDWSPEVACLSRRRALYLPNWLGADPGTGKQTLEEVINQPDLLFGSHPLGAFIINPAWTQAAIQAGAPPALTNMVADFIRDFPAVSRQNVESYQILWVK